MTDHRCLDDLANLRQHAVRSYWVCTECNQKVHIWRVVEALRVRAVAQDAAERLKHIEVDVFPFRERS